MNEKYTAGTFLKISMKKSYKDVKLIPPSTKIHNAHVPGLLQALQ